ncbi:MULTISPECIES: hypothetical protein [Microbacterium]|uniref:hypothetical protein n=1 Tax=Microbacterium TaxID=33882 RepID=UPI0009C27485|nr:MULTISPECIES: hypothetical protein [Microbacterium]AQY02212.1 hypothetical protein B2G67_12610 [Microbacterium foliorum]
MIATALGQLLGCAPGPAPVPTPTPAFSSEEEAFAAAEEVYRAYNDALNQSRIATDTPPNPRIYLTGPALESDLEATRYLQAQGLEVIGEGTVAGFDGTAAALNSGEVEVTANVCLDVSHTQVVDANGGDVTPQGRPTRLPLNVAFVGSDGALLISSSNLIESDAC